MSTGDARRSRSTFFFNVSKKGEILDVWNNQIRKRVEKKPVLLFWFIKTQLLTIGESSETTQIASLLPHAAAVYRNINKGQTALKFN